MNEIKVMQIVIDPETVIGMREQLDLITQADRLTTKLLDKGAEPVDIIDAHVDAWIGAAIKTGLDPSTLLPVAGWEPGFGIEAEHALVDFFTDRDSREASSAVLKGGA
ncbi:hypothetical protein [Mycobacterium sp. NPDC050853]|uniref:hypothetical protein n=1 Tax=Mycobacterium sp. NPDC050853 TaxID=3155160 RepID=UPI0033F16F39